MIDRFITVQDFEDSAAEVLPKMAFDYFRSGAEQETTLQKNRTAFDRYELWYRVLVDVESVDTSTEILGTRIQAPVMVAPTAYQKMAHALGESSCAMGAASAGTIMVDPPLPRPHWRRWPHRPKATNGSSFTSTRIAA